FNPQKKPKVAEATNKNVKKKPSSKNVEYMYIFPFAIMKSKDVKKYENKRNIDNLGMNIKPDPLR
ncbi:MAG: hypothetical protein KDI39_20730, partial [Pseudomonadales bacterium]|nr:hypothetical protein [Pseudomonadales bacterium]